MNITEVSYGYHASPFGEMILVRAEQGLLGLGFVDKTREAAFEDMKHRWPNLSWRWDVVATAQDAARIFTPGAEVKILLTGSPFALRVFEALRKIPMGQTTSYARLASQMDAPHAARAVGKAVGSNPLAFVVPCHRVIGSQGALTGYRWGLARKQAILDWEAKTTATP